MLLLLSIIIIARNVNAASIVVMSFDRIMIAATAISYQMVIALPMIHAVMGAVQ